MEKRLHNTVVSSQRYPNYHVLHGMDQTHIVQLLMDIARRQNYRDLDKLESFVKVFISIAGSYFTPSLASLVKLTKQYPRIQQLEELGQQAHISPEDLEALSAYPLGIQNLQNLLNLLISAFEQISPPKVDTGANLLTGVPRGRLLCLRINSTQPRIMDLELASELEQLLASGQKFMLILNDVPLLCAEGLYQQIRNAKNVYSGIHVSICTKNISSWIRSLPQASNEENTLLNNTQNLVVFHQDTDSDGDLAGVLQYLGQYMRYEVVLGGGHGEKLFSIFHSANWQVVAVGWCNRVTPRDMAGYGVLLKGHQGRQIHLHHGIDT